MIDPATNCPHCQRLAAAFALEAARSPEAPDHHPLPPPSSRLMYLSSGRGVEVEDVPLARQDLL